MEVYLESFGEKKAVEVGERDTVGDVKELARREFGYGAVDLKILVEGEVVGDGDIVGGLGVGNGDEIRVEMGYYLPTRQRGWIPIENVRHLDISEHHHHLAVATASCTVIIHQIPPRLPIATLHLPSSPMHLTFHKSYLIAATASTIHVWSTPQYATTYRTTTPTRVLCMAPTPNHIVWCGLDTTTLVKYDGCLVQRHGFGGCCVAARVDGVAAVASSSKKIHILESDGGAVSGCFACGGLVKAMVFLQDVLVLQCADAVKVFSVQGGFLLHKVDPRPYCALLSGSQLHNTIVIAEGRTAYVMDEFLGAKAAAPTPSLIRTLTVPPLAAFFITAGHTHTRLHDLTTGRELATLDTEAFLAAATSSGSHIVTAARHGVSIWF